MSNGHVVESFKTLSTLLAYRIVGPSTSTANTVTYPSSAGALPFGVTVDQAFNSQVAVQMNGLAKVYFNDTVSAGGLVAADSSGRGIPWAIGTTATASTMGAAFIGRLVGPAVALTGTIARVAVAPAYGRRLN